MVSMTKVTGSVNAAVAGSLKRTTTVVPRRKLVVSKAAKTPSWYPGKEAPKYLDANGPLPGNYGFDPLKLGTEKDQLKW